MAGINLSGLVNGFDWQSIVNQLIAVDQQPITKLQTEISDNDQKTNALGTLGTKMTALQTSVDALKAAGLFSGRTAASSASTGAWSTNAADGTAIGTYSINVTQLAAQASRTGANDIGKGLSDTTDVSGLTIATLPTAAAVTAGIFTVNGQQITVTSSETLQQVFSDIATVTGNAVTAAYDPATDKIKLTSSGEIMLGAANDTSNFFSVMRLSNTDPLTGLPNTGTINSSGPLGTTNTTAKLTNARLRATLTDGDGAGNGTFTINGVSINYNLNTDSLSTVMARINTSTAGVIANYDGVNDRLVLTNKTTGDTGIAVSDTSGNLLSALGMTSGTTFKRGTNALFSVNGGATLSSASNTLNATAHGITGLNVTATTKDTQTITVAANTDAMKTAINDFITKYNDVQLYIDDETKVTVTDNKVSAALLSDNREIQNWASKLRSMAFSAVSGLTGTIGRLSDLGIDFNGTEAQLVVKDSTKLDAALANHPDDVQSFFSTKTTGFVASFDTFFTQTMGTDGTSGTLGMQKDTFAKSTTNLNQQIADLTRRLAAEKETLTNGFIAMQSAQQQANSILQQLSSSFGTSSSSISTSSASAYSATS